MTRHHITRRSGTPKPRAGAMIVASLAAGLFAAGCGNSATDSTPKAAPQDYGKLPIQASDIVLPGDTFASPKPAQGFPDGAAVGFWNGDHSRVIDDRIIITQDSDTATKGFEAAKAKMSTALPNTTVTDVPVGQGAAMAVAISKDGAKDVNTIAFHEDKAVVTMEFDSPVNNPYPEGFPVAVAQKQDAAVKTGLAA